MSPIVLAATPCSAAWSQHGCAPATLRGRPAQGSPLGDTSPHPRGGKSAWRFTASGIHHVLQPKAETFHVPSVLAGVSDHPSLEDHSPAPAFPVNAS